jgi:hypothetical protein
MHPGLDLHRYLIQFQTINTRRRYQVNSADTLSTHLLESANGTPAQSQQCLPHDERQPPRLLPLETHPSELIKHWKCPKSLARHSSLDRHLHQLGSKEQPANNTARSPSTTTNEIRQNTLSQIRGARQLHQTQDTAHSPSEEQPKSSVNAMLQRALQIAHQRQSTESNPNHRPTHEIRRSFA